METRDLLDLVWIVPALPAAGAALLLVLGKRIGEPVAGWIATGLMALSFAGSVIAFGLLRSLSGDEKAHVSTLWTWISSGDFRVSAGLLVDPLSVTMMLFVTGIGALIHLYSIGYMHGDERFSRYFAYLNLFAASMLVLVLGDSFLVTFLGWEGVGLCSYLLISFWFERDTAAVAGKKAFITNRVGDFGFMLAMFLIVAHVGTLSYAALPAAGGLAGGTATAVALLLFVGAVGKSAQIPLHIWLPDAMEGPTPVSALIHAATMVTAGVFLLARSFTYLEAAPGAADLVAWVGAITALAAATVAVVQYDIKRVLAYSTISQLGYMFLALGVGAYEAAIFHMITHAAFKALLFLGAGSVIHGLHDEQDMRAMGGLRKYMPITAVTFIVGWLAIAGIFPLAGFWSKDEILVQAWLGGDYVLWLVGGVGALLTAFYMTRQVWLVFYGNERWRPEPEPGTGAREHDTPHEAPWTMTVPLIALAALAATAGLLNLPFSSPVDLTFLADWLAPAFAGAEGADAAFTTGFALATTSLIVAVIGVVAAVALYRRGLPADRTDPGVERLGAVAPVLEHAYCLDDTVARFVSGPGRTGFAFLADTVDTKVIDGAVDGVAGGLAGLGGRLRRLQTGRVRQYALAIAVGAVALLAYLLWVAF